jgi:hypothetical protein
MTYVLLPTSFNCKTTFITITSINILSPAQFLRFSAIARHTGTSAGGDGPKLGDWCKINGVTVLHNPDGGYTTFHQERRVIILVRFSFRVLPTCERFHLALKYCCSYVLLSFNLVLLRHHGHCLCQVEDKYNIPQM